ncbi:MAG TPA: hypothetical protein VD994_03120 [Prosthecobacter sp.]|nr:hypothetical protein [Prosthecobacter sp.]
MKVVYSLWHRYTTRSWNDVERLLGVYSTRARAEAAIRRLKGQPGFRRRPDGFEIDDETLDFTQLRQGFITVRAGKKARMSRPKFPAFCAAAAALLTRPSVR